MATTDGILMLNRFSGILLWSCSCQGNIFIFNCVWMTKIQSNTQKWYLVSTVASMVTETMMVCALVGWVLDSTWSGFTPLVVAMNVLKRIYSIAPVSLMYRRFEVIQERPPNPLYLHCYTAGYAALSLTTALLHFLSYDDNGWVSIAARESDVFRYGYRTMNIITSAYYFFLTMYCNLKLLTAKRGSMEIADCLYHFRRYFNLYLNLSYEILFYLAFLVSTIWSFYNPDVTAALYIEQCLLTYSTLNAYLTSYTSISDMDVLSTSKNDPSRRKSSIEPEHHRKSTTGPEQRRKSTAGQMHQVVIASTKIPPSNESH